ncbi:hypothetical protein FRB97_007411 [Tulasnella sp. 331]|nr:hypothetical protein FRB97_007411 [Tulasnella sp. 331]
MPRFPRLTYTITRDIHWRVEPLVYLVALLAIAILIPLNYALTGYEVVPTSSPDYNYVPNHWYSRFAPRPKPGSYCSPNKLTIGDSFVTNTSILTYQLVTVLGSSKQTSSQANIDYKGTTLESCDVLYMSARVDARLLTSVIMAGVACTDEMGFPVVFSTSFNSAAYHDDPSTSLGLKFNYQIAIWTEIASLGFAVSSYLEYAATDLFTHVSNIYQSMPNGTGPALISVSADPGNSTFPSWWCSVSNSTTDSACRTTNPNIPLALDDMTLLDMNGGIIDTPSLADKYASAVSNAMQVMLAAVRLDLGNVLPNNILVNQSSELIDATIASSFPGDRNSSELYPLFNSANGPSVVVGEEEKFPSVIAAEYQCKVEQRKSAGSILVAVSVATLTLFKGGWAVFLLILTFLAKRAQPEDCQACAGHEDLVARVRELERLQFSSPPLGKLEKEA